MTSPDQEAALPELPEPQDPQEIAARIAAGEPAHQVLGLEGPDKFARTALNRERAAARAKGLFPGKAGPKRFIEAQVTGSGKDGRDPKLLGDTLGRLLAVRGWKQDVAVGGVIGRWPEIVGADIAANCRAESFDNNVLIIRAASTAWATQLRFLAPQLLVTVAKAVGEGVVLEIHILAPDGPKFTRGRYTVKGRGPRDTWG